MSAARSAISRLGLSSASSRHSGAQLSPAQREFLLSRYLYPEPRLALQAALAGEASAAMDISDGLALDLSRMCTASQVTAEVQVSALPLSDATQILAAFGEGAMQTILTGGDDYEILAAVPPERAGAFEAASRGAGVQVTRIGAVKAGSEAPSFIAADGARLSLSVRGFEHFQV